MSNEEPTPELHSYGTNPGDQLKAAMLPKRMSTVELKFNPIDQFVSILQNFGQDRIIFLSPKMIKDIAGVMIKIAEDWEQGKLPGMIPPKQKQKDV